MIEKVKAVIRVLTILIGVVVCCMLAYKFIADHWQEILITAGMIVVLLIIAWTFDY